MEWCRGMNVHGICFRSEAVMQLAAVQACKQAGVRRWLFEWTKNFPIRHDPHVTQINVHTVSTKHRQQCIFFNKNSVLHINEVVHYKSSLYKTQRLQMIVYVRIATISDASLWRKEEVFTIVWNSKPQKAYISKSFLIRLFISIFCIPLFYHLL
jgi:hypothetical protein